MFKKNMDFTTLDLRDGEKQLMSGPANKWQIIGSKGGTLFLTNQRIVFKAHPLNFGSKFDSYELSEIQQQGNTVNIKTSSNLGISCNISFSTKKGEKLKFVVTNKQKDEWISKICEAVTKHAKSIFANDETKSKEEIEEITSKIRTVQCEGCAAFVIVTTNVASKCDYCGRPVVG